MLLIAELFSQTSVVCVCRRARSVCVRTRRLVQACLCARARVLWVAACTALLLDALCVFVCVAASFLCVFVEPESVGS